MDRPPPELSTLKLSVDCYILSQLNKGYRFSPKPFHGRRLYADFMLHEQNTAVIPTRGNVYYSESLVESGNAGIFRESLGLGEGRRDSSLLHKNPVIAT